MSTREGLRAESPGERVSTIFVQRPETIPWEPSPIFYDILGLLAVGLMVHEKKGCCVYEAVLVRVDRWGVVFCVILGIALRSLLIGSSWDQLTLDRDAYLGIARSVSQGNGFCTPETSIPTAYRPPVYPLQLSVLMILTSEAIAVAFLNLLWGGIAIWATGETGRILGLRSFSVLPSLLVAIDPLLLEYSTQPMTEETCAGLVALLLFWIVRRAEHVNMHQFVAGLLFGLLVLSRPTFWPFVGILLMGWSLIWISMPKEQRQFASVIESAMRVVVGTLVVVAPWVLRNEMVMNSPILTTTHGGYTLLLANNPVFYEEVVDHGWGALWSDDSFNRWQENLQSEILQQLGPNSTETERDRWQSMRAREFISSHPDQLLHAVGFRILSLWSPVPQGAAASRVKAWLILAVGWYYRLVLLGFAIGLILVAVGNRRSQWWPLYAMILTIQIVHLFYWTNARMRAPLVPVISLFAVAPLSRRSDPSSPEHPVEVA